MMAGEGHGDVHHCGQLSQGKMGEARCVIRNVKILLNT